MSGKNAYDERGQLNDFDERDDRHADPQAELTADVRDQSYEIVVGRLSRLYNVAVCDVDDDTSQQVLQTRLLQHDHRHQHQPQCRHHYHHRHCHHYLLTSVTE